MSIATDFDDLEDAAFATPRDLTVRNTVEGVMAVAALQAPNEAYRETCTACNGTKVFRSWSGRAVGQCFKCKGKEFKTFATSPEVRAASKVSYASKKASASGAFRSEYPAEVEYLTKLAGVGNTFANSLLSTIDKYGALTDKQMAAVHSGMAKAAAKEEAKATNSAIAVARSTEVDVTKIQSAFDAARANFVPRPKMNLGSFTFSRAPDTGKNPGAIYVKEGSEYLGKIVAGKLYPVIACTEVRKTEIAAIAADPFASAIAYGMRTRNCAICNRSLVVTESVDRGIGPICAEKYGW